jgi:hypothetical protein
MKCDWTANGFDNLDPEKPVNFDTDFSDSDPNYNCIGWAIDPEKPRNWWPGRMPNYEWPRTLNDKRATPENFIKAFSIKGYLPCADGKLEDGIEKVALYARPDSVGKPVITHASRQLSNGKWTSKLGMCEDIKHYTPEDVNGPIYGVVIQFLSRKRK